MHITYEFLLVRAILSQQSQQQVHALIKPPFLDVSFDVPTQAADKLRTPLLLKVLDVGHNFDKIWSDPSFLVIVVLASRWRFGPNAGFFSNLGHLYSPISCSLGPTR